MKAKKSHGNKIDFAVGGQAVIEGVMMRSPNYTVITVRKENGELVQKVEKYTNLIRRIRFLNIPLVRGVINLFEMLFIGTKALNFASSQFMDEGTTSDEKTQKSSFWSNLVLISTIVFSLAFTIFLFKLLPFAATSFLEQQIPFLGQNYFFFNLVDGLIKISLFIAYLWLIAKMPEIKRVFQYHGAEHKSIATYEAGQDLTVENALKNSRFHPRCGTSFIILVFLLSIAIYTILPKAEGLVEGSFFRILFLPLIAGFSYELLKISAKYSDNPLISLITKPGLALQKITTQEPDEKQLEVALHSLKKSLDLEQQ